MWKHLQNKNSLLLGFFFQNNRCLEPCISLMAMHEPLRLLYHRKPYGASKIETKNIFIRILSQTVGSKLRNCSNISNASTKWRMNAYFLKWGWKGGTRRSTIWAIVPDKVPSKSASCMNSVFYRHEVHKFWEAAAGGGVQRWLLIFFRNNRFVFVWYSALVSIRCHHWPQICSLWRKRVAEKNKLTIDVNQVSHFWWNANDIVDLSESLSSVLLLYASL